MARWVVDMARILFRLYPFSIGQYRIVNSRTARKVLPCTGSAVGRLSCGASILCDLEDHDGRAIYFAGGNDPKVRRIIHQIVRPGDACIDIGANHGEYTLACGSRAGPNGAVHAFEPHPEVAERLRESVRLSGLEQIAVHACGLSRSGGEADLLTFRGRSGLGRIAREGADGERSKVRVRVHEAGSALAELHVDDLRLLKIDVEGDEAEILRAGAEPLRAMSPDFVVFESNCRRTPFWDRDVVSAVNAIGHYVFFEIPRACIYRRPRRIPDRWDAFPKGRDFVAVKPKCME